MNPPQQFSEEKYQEEFKKVRNVLRKYSRESIIDRALIYLKTDIQQNHSEARKRPWLTFLIIKWAFLDRGPWQRLPLDSRMFLDLMNKVSNLVDFTRLPSEYDNISLFIRAHLYQQDIYQRRFSQIDIARQLILFNEVDPQSVFRREFERKTGISVSVFFDCSFMIAGHAILKEPHLLHPEWFNSISATYPQADIVKFLNNLAVPLDKLENKLAPHAANRGQSSEYFEQTPFLEFPLIKITKNGDSRYIYPHQNILFRTLEHFAFDLLKRMDSGKFLSKFGRAFERYVSRIMEFHNIAFQNEDFIKRLSKSDESIADFWIQEADCNIFIDVKGVEMNKSGKVTYRSGDLRRATKSHVRKAIKQCNSAARIVCREFPENISTENFTVIVTYKELYLGNGEGFFDIIGDTEYQRIAEEFGELAIPKANIFFLTISDFERLACNTSQSAQTIGGFLRKVRDDDSNIPTHKFNFELHLNNRGYHAFPSFLDHVYEESMDRILAALEKAETIATTSKSE